MFFVVMLAHEHPFFKSLAQVYLLPIHTADKIAHYQ